MIANREPRNSWREKSAAFLTGAMVAIVSCLMWPPLPLTGDASWRLPLLGVAIAWNVWIAIGHPGLALEAADEE